LIFPVGQGDHYHGPSGITGPVIPGEIVTVSGIHGYLLCLRKLRDVFDTAEYAAIDPRGTGISKD